MKYKIIFDTEAVWNNQESPLNVLFHSSILDVINFLKTYGVENADICLPELVIEERIQQKAEIIEKISSKINADLLRINSLRYKFKPIKLRKEIPSELRKIANKFVKDHAIEILPMPELNSKELVDRALKKMKPFDDKSSGFKDTVILLSIISHARLQKVKTIYILITNNNTDFTEEVVHEFTRITKLKLLIVSDIEELKSLLDEIVPLGLKLKELHKQIEQGIRENTGTMISELNKTIKKRSRSGMFTESFIPVVPKMGELSMYNIMHSNHLEIMGYNFSELDIRNISEIMPSTYKVEGVLIAEVKYEDNMSLASHEMLSYLSELQGKVFNSNKGFAFEAIYDNENRRILEINFQT